MCCPDDTATKPSGRGGVMLSSIHSINFNAELYCDATACNLCFISLLLMLYLINAFRESIIHPLIDKQYIPSAHTHQPTNP